MPPKQGSPSRASETRGSPRGPDQSARATARCWEDGRGDASDLWERSGGDDGCRTVGRRVRIAGGDKRWTGQTRGARELTLDREQIGQATKLASGRLEE